MDALKGELDIGKNTGFRVYDKGVVTYEQNKLGLLAYYDKTCFRRWYTLTTTFNINRSEK